MYRGQPPHEDPEPHDGADDGMGRGDGKSQVRGQVKPHPRGKKGGEHAQDEELRLFLEYRGGDDSLADRVGYVPPNQERPREFENRRQQDGLPQCDRVGPHGRPHGVGHVVGPDVPGHVDAGRHGDPEHPGFETEHDPVLLREEKTKAVAHLLCAVGDVPHALENAHPEDDVQGSQLLLQGEELLKKIMLQDIRLMFHLA